MFVLKHISHWLLSKGGCFCVEAYKPLVAFKGGCICVEAYKPLVAFKGWVYLF